MTPRFPVHTQGLQEGWVETCAILRGAAHLLRNHAAAFAGALLAIGGLALVAHTSDHRVYEWVASRRTEGLRHVAREVSAWGDFERFTLTVTAAAWSVGALARRPKWRAAGSACLVAALLAGATANIVRAVVGRPRPSAGLPDRPMGLVVDHRLHSFPSAHSATSLATASALAVAQPAAGIPLLAAAAAVPWSRMYMRDHYFSDVVAGVGLGLWWGVVLGLAARRVTRAAAQEQRGPPPTSAPGLSRGAV